MVDKHIFRKNSVDDLMHREWVSIIKRHGFTMTSVYEIYSTCVFSGYTDILLCTISITNSPHLDWLYHLLPSIVTGTLTPDCKLYDENDTMVELTLFDDRFKWHVVDLLSIPIDELRLAPEDIVDTVELNDPKSSLYLMATSKDYFHAPILLKPKQLGVTVNCASITLRMGRGMSNPYRYQFDEAVSGNYGSNLNI